MLIFPVGFNIIVGEVTVLRLSSSRLLC